MGSLRRRLALRPALAAVAFALATAAAAWPIHYQAPSGVNLYGATNQFTLTEFTTRTCAWQFQLGHRPSTIPAAPPPRSSATVYLLNSYDDSACAARRYDRTSEALLFLLVGFGLTISSIRHDAQATRQPSRVPVPA
jgi:hypothetical protein